MITRSPYPILPVADEEAFFEPERLAAVDAGADANATVDSGVIDPARILIDRPDVLASYFQAFHSALNDWNSDAWVKRVGGVTAEDYARYWYDAYGRAEGYDPSRASLAPERVEILRQMSGAEAGAPVRTTFDGLQLDFILANRPDVLRAYYEGYYGDGNDRNSDAWAKRVGGETAQDYANYWYERYGRWEGYGVGMSAASEQIDIERLLRDRPDVFRDFFEKFYGEGNDRRSQAWSERVGGETVEDYAKYWYVTYGQREGYTQRPAASPEDPIPPDATATESPSHEVTDDPLSPTEVFPGWQPLDAGWHSPSDADFFG